MRAPIADLHLKRLDWQNPSREKESRRLGARWPPRTVTPLVPSAVRWSETPKVRDVGTSPGLTPGSLIRPRSSRQPLLVVLRRQRTTCHHWCCGWPGEAVSVGGACARDSLGVATVQMLPPIRAVGAVGMALLALTQPVRTIWTTSIFRPSEQRDTCRRWAMENFNHVACALNWMTGFVGCNECCARSQVHAGVRALIGDRANRARMSVSAISSEQAAFRELLQVRAAYMDDLGSAKLTCFSFVALPSWGCWRGECRRRCCGSRHSELFWWMATIACSNRETGSKRKAGGWVRSHFLGAWFSCKMTRRIVALVLAASDCIVSAGRFFIEKSSKMRSGILFDAHRALSCLRIQLFCHSVTAFANLDTLCRRFRGRPLRRGRANTQESYFQSGGFRRKLSRALVEETSQTRGDWYEYPCRKLRHRS